MTKKQYKKFLDVFEYEVKKAVVTELRLEKGENDKLKISDNDLKKIIAAMLILWYNTQLWNVLKIDELLSLPTGEEKIQNLVKKFVEQHEELIVDMIGKEKVETFKKIGIEKFAYDFPYDIEQYFEEYFQKLENDINEFVLMKREQLEIEGISEKEVNKKVIDELASFLAFRINTLATTETARFYNLGILRSGRIKGVVAYRYQAIDDPKTCPKCRSLNGKIILADDIENLLLYTPPLHPNCRCRIIPLSSIPSNLKLINDIPLDLEHITKREIDYNLIRSVL